MVALFIVLILRRDNTKVSFVKILARTGVFIECALEIVVFEIVEGLSEGGLIGDLIAIVEEGFRTTEEVSFNFRASLRRRHKGTSKNTKAGVIPAKAGIQVSDSHLSYWIPAFAGMTVFWRTRRRTARLHNFGLFPIFLLTTEQIRGTIDVLFR